MHESSQAFWIKLFSIDMYTMLRSSSKYSFPHSATSPVRKEERLSLHCASRNPMWCCLTCARNSLRPAKSLFLLFIWKPWLQHFWQPNNQLPATLWLQLLDSIFTTDALKIAGDVPNIPLKEQKASSKVGAEDSRNRFCHRCFQLTTPFEFSRSIR